MNLKPNKSPGLDDLDNEFYKCFWGDLKQLYKDTQNTLLKMIK